jgi:hypothetical protein
MMTKPERENGKGRSRMARDAGKLGAKGEIAMTTMWKVYIGWTRAPVEVEVEKVTDKSVWIDGRRKSRETEWECYFETY